MKVQSCLACFNPTCVYNLKNKYQKALSAALFLPQARSKVKHTFLVLLLSHWLSCSKESDSGWYSVWSLQQVFIYCLFFLSLIRRLSQSFLLHMVITGWCFIVDLFCVLMSNYVIIRVHVLPGGSVLYFSLNTEIDKREPYICMHIKVCKNTCRLSKSHDNWTSFCTRPSSVK